MTRRIALLCNHAPAVAGFRGPLIRDMVKRDAVVYAFAPNYTDRTKKQVVELGAVPVDFQMNRTGANLVQEMLAVVRLERLLRGLRIDVCLGFMTKLVVYGSIAAFFAGVRNRYSMIEGLGYFFTKDDRKVDLRKTLIRSAITLLYRLCLPLNRTLFFLNPDDPADLAAEGALGRTSVLVLDGGIGIDIREYTSASLDGESVTFLLVARLLREKGVREYVSAAERLKQAYPQVRFVLVGSEDTNPGGIGETEARDWVERGTLDWPGAVPDAKPWYRSANVYVLPSYREGMPRTVLEAMALGRPVITSDAPGCREAVQRLDSNETIDLRSGRFPATGRVIHGRNGFLVPVRDVEALAEAMEYFVVNPELIPRMGAESRRLAEERFDVRKVNARILQEIGL